MKIGVMLRHLKEQRGGIGRYTQQLLKHLFKIDRDNRYCLMYRDEELIGSYAEYPNVEEVVLGGSSNLLWDQVAVPTFAKANRLDLIFNPKLSLPFVSPCKQVFVMHGADWFVFPQNYTFYDRLYHKIFAPLYCRKADAIISISMNATQELLDNTGIDQQKIRTIYHGVEDTFHPIDDKDFLLEVRKKYHLPYHFILFVGQLYPMKNIGGIIQAFYHLHQRVPHKLVIVGKPTLKYKQELSLIDKYHLQQDILLTGWVPDEVLPAFYNLADLFIFPSFYEGFGLPLLEAMACGCPIVTSQTGSPPEVVGNAARLVDPHDVMDIAEAMYEVLTDELLRQALIAKGYRRVRQFSWLKCARQTLDVFEDLVSPS